MLSVIAAIVTLIVSVSGVFFSKHGERNKVNGVGYALLTIILVGGVFTIVQAVRSNSSNALADQKITTLSEKLKEQSTSIDYLQQALLHSQEEMIQLTTPLIDTFKRVNFSFSGKIAADVNSSGDLPGFIGPIPIKDDAVKSVRINFYLQDAIDASFEFTKKDGRFFLTETPDPSKPPVKSEIKDCKVQCYFNVAGKYWVSEALNDEYFHSVVMDSDRSGARVVAFFVKHADFGTFTIEHDQPFGSKSFLEKLATNFPMEMKIYGRKDQDCRPLVYGKFGLQPESETQTTTTYNIVRIGALHYTSCEEVKN